MLNELAVTPEAHANFFRDDLSRPAALRARNLDRIPLAIAALQRLPLDAVRDDSLTGVNFFLWQTDAIDVVRA